MSLNSLVSFSKYSKPPPSLVVVGQCVPMFRKSIVTKDMETLGGTSNSPLITAFLAAKGVYALVLDLSFAL